MSQSLFQSFAIVSALVALTVPAISYGVPPKRKPAVSAPKTEPAACAALHDQYEDASKRLSTLEAKDGLDNSAPRATMRQAEKQNILQEARMTTDLMRDSRCKLPTSIPNGMRYYRRALACQGAIIEVQNGILFRGERPTEAPPECIRANWKPDD